MQRIFGIMDCFFSFLIVFIVVAVTVANKEPMELMGAAIGKNGIWVGLRVR